MATAGVLILRLVAIAAGVPASPSPAEGCHQISPNVIDCNFDRQEEQLTWVIDHVSYVLIAVAVCFLALAIYSFATGKSPMPESLSRRLRRTPASVADHRKLSAATAISTAALIVNLAAVSLSDPGGFGHPAGPLAGSPAPLFGVLAVFLGLLLQIGVLSQVRFIDRRNGTVSSSLDQLRGRPPLSVDGLYYWDGQRWITTLSPDGRFRWNGSAWVPASDGPGS